MPGELINYRVVNYRAPPTGVININTYARFQLQPTRVATLADIVDGHIAGEIINDGDPWGRPELETFFGISSTDPIVSGFASQNRWLYRGLGRRPLQVTFSTIHGSVTTMWSLITSYVIPPSQPSQGGFLSYLALRPRANTTGTWDDLQLEEGILVNVTCIELPEVQPITLTTGLLSNPPPAYPNVVRQATIRYTQDYYEALSLSTSLNVADQGWGGRDVINQLEPSRTLRGFQRVLDTSSGGGPLDGEWTFQALNETPGTTQGAIPADALNFGWWNAEGTNIDGIRPGFSRASNTQHSPMTSTIPAGSTTWDYPNPGTGAIRQWLAEGKSRIGEIRIANEDTLFAGITVTRNTDDNGSITSLSFDPALPADVTVSWTAHLFETYTIARLSGASGSADNPTFPLWDQLVAEFTRLGVAGAQTATGSRPHFKTITTTGPVTITQQGFMHSHFRDSDTNQLGDHNGSIVVPAGTWRATNGLFDANSYDAPPWIENYSNDTAYFISAPVGASSTFRNDLISPNLLRLGGVTSLSQSPNPPFNLGVPVFAQYGATAPTDMYTIESGIHYEASAVSVIRLGLREDLFPVTEDETVLGRRIITNNSGVTIPNFSVMSEGVSTTPGDFTAGSTVIVNGIIDYYTFNVNVTADASGVGDVVGVTAPTEATLNGLPANGGSITNTIAYNLPNTSTPVYGTVNGAMTLDSAGPAVTTVEETYNFPLQGSGVYTDNADSERVLFSWPIFRFAPQYDDFGFDQTEVDANEVLPGFRLNVSFVRNRQNFSASWVGGYGDRIRGLLDAGGVTFNISNAIQSGDTVPLNQTVSYESWELRTLEAYSPALLPARTGFGGSASIREQIYNTTNDPRSNTGGYLAGPTATTGSTGSDITLQNTGARIVTFYAREPNSQFSNDVEMISTSSTATYADMHDALDRRGLISSGDRTSFRVARETIVRTRTGNDTDNRVIVLEADTDYSGTTALFPNATQPASGITPHRAAWFYATPIRPLSFTRAVYRPLHAHVALVHDRGFDSQDEFNNNFSVSGFSFSGSDIGTDTDTTTVLNGVNDLDGANTVTFSSGGVSAMSSVVTEGTAMFSRDGAMLTVMGFSGMINNATWRLIGLPDGSGIDTSAFTVASDTDGNTVFTVPTAQRASVLALPTETMLQFEATNFPGTANAFSSSIPVVLPVAPQVVSAEFRADAMGNLNRAIIVTLSSAFEEADGDLDFRVGRFVTGTGDEAGVGSIIRTGDSGANGFDWGPTEAQQNTALTGMASPSEAQINAAIRGSTTLTLSFADGDITDDTDLVFGIRVDSTDAEEFQYVPVTGWSDEDAESITAASYDIENNTLTLTFAEEVTVRKNLLDQLARRLELDFDGDRSSQFLPINRVIGVQGNTLNSSSNFMVGTSAWDQSNEVTATSISYTPNRLRELLEDYYEESNTPTEANLRVELAESIESPVASLNGINSSRVNLTLSGFDFDLGLKGDGSVCVMNPFPPGSNPTPPSIGGVDPVQVQGTNRWTYAGGVNAALLINLGYDLVDTYSDVPALPTASPTVRPILVEDVLWTEFELRLIKGSTSEQGRGLYLNSYDTGSSRWAVSGAVIVDGSGRGENALLDDLNRAFSQNRPIAFDPPPEVISRGVTNSSFAVTAPSANDDFINLPTLSANVRDSLSTGTWLSFSNITDDSSVITNIAETKIYNVTNVDATTGDVSVWPSLPSDISRTAMVSGDNAKLIMQITNTNLEIESIPDNDRYKLVRLELQEII